ncbi:hypothetical protein AB0I28_15265 [Phytomonospora sp. NPDC050363]|uniref:hypothetical protein n=1 Tax=Phytomonospora sp. NPDC050363 TaxID=3155642 RepID=UPI0033F5D0C1
MKTLGGFGDRLLARLVPKARAHATVCFFEHVCKPHFSCVKTGVRVQRKVCTNGYKGPWVAAGCC